jgi:signal transduction histidine kinase
MLEGGPEGTMVRSGAVALPPAAPVRSRRGPVALDTAWVNRSQAILAVAAFAMAAAAVWITLRADFLAYPGWLAAQKADMILGPVLIGLYWLRRRPASRFGPLLIAIGFLSAPYLLQSSAAPLAFSLGVLWEGPIFLITLALILAFPSGRLDGAAERLILAVAVIGVVIPIAVAVLVSPQLAAGATISGCSGACPANGLLVTPDAALASRMIDGLRVVIAVLDLATIALIAWRFAAGTPPRRRALAVGVPIALVFLVTQVAHQVVQLWSLQGSPVSEVVTWAYVAARACLWYGFLLALVVAELFAGRVLRRVVETSLRRPSLSEIEAMLRGPLGDPRLRLVFWHSASRAWVDGEGVRTVAPADRVLTVAERDGRPAAGVIHDAQLAEEPELVHAAGAVALLARENAELELAWTDSVRQLRESRARIATAGEVERRALERDLHDGAQQQLTALLVRMTLVGELVPRDSPAQVQLARLANDLEQTLEELRRLAHGIYPAPLADAGLVRALEVIARRSGGAISVTGGGIGRFSPALESAVYFCCLEAVQNASKHVGPGVGITILLRQIGTELRFEVRDDGPGFDVAEAYDGVGLRNMHDRLDALHGRLEITSASGRGTVVAGTVPVA